MCNNFCILIVENDEDTRYFINEYLLELGIKNIYFTQTYQNALELVKNNCYDLVLIDVHHNEDIDSIELGNKLYKLCIPYIYMSSSIINELPCSLCKTNAIAYLAKPIKKVEFQINIRLILNSKVNEYKHIVNLTDGKHTCKVDIHEIIYIFSLKNYVQIHLKCGKKMEIRNKLENILREINCDLFLQSHRSFFINKQNISKIANKYIEVYNNAKRPLSRNYKINFNVN